MGKTLLVIGASSEMGVATIREVQEQYEHIYAHYNHMNDMLRELFDELAGKIIGFPADLLDEAAVDGMIDSLRTMPDSPDHIVHFPAGFIETRKFHKTKWSTFQTSIDISVRSLCKVLGAFLPAMEKKKAGKIVVMLSMVVHNMPPKYNSDYVMTKYALLGLVKSLAVEYGEKGITVNGVSPSLVETKFVSHLHEFIIQQNAENSPTGKNLQVGDVVPAIHFLLSEGADCINGQNILVTCGR